MRALGRIVRKLWFWSDFLTARLNHIVSAVFSLSVLILHLFRWLIYTFRASDAAPDANTPRAVKEENDDTLSDGTVLVPT